MTSQETKTYLPAAGLLILGPLAVLYATQAIWLDSLTAPLPWMAAHPSAVLLFWGIFSGLSGTLWGLTKRPFVGYLPWTVALPVLAYISRVKMNINGIPLQLSDFTLAGGLDDIAGYAADKLMPSPSMAGAMVLCLALLVVLAWKGKWFRLPPVTNLLLFLVGLFLTATAVLPGPLRTGALTLDAGCYDQAARNAEEGVILGLYAAWAQRMETGSVNAQTEALAASFLENAGQDPADLPAESTPDIIFIASESFFDITRLPNLTFEADPLPNFHALSETCTNGTFLSNTYGGGTGWVEMEMFTGLTASLLKEGDTLSTLPEELYDTLPTTVRHLSGLGYSTLALHAHSPKLYNREVVYPAIGFDQVLFHADFQTPAEEKGAYVTDEAFVNELIHHYEQRDPSRPAFLYGLSMQNHQPYYADRYEEHSGFPAQSDVLTEGDLAALDALVMGLHDADTSLRQLVNYFSGVDRPVMIVFVGDHPPSLALEAGDSLYTRLGLSPTDDATLWDPETNVARYATDYLIWTNYETQPQPDKTSSATFLGLEMLTRAGLPLNDWFTWLRDDIAPHMLVNRGKLFVDAAGTPAYEVPTDARGTLDLYTNVERAMVYGGQTEE